MMNRARAIILLSLVSLTLSACGTYRAGCGLREMYLPAAGGSAGTIELIDLGPCPEGQEPKAAPKRPYDPTSVYRNKYEQRSRDG